MWIAVLEDTNGIWNDDPIGAFTKEEAEKLAIERWTKIEEGERIAIYYCDYKGNINPNLKICIE